MASRNGIVHEGNSGTTGKFKVTLPSEYKVTDEQNGYELFDPFFDPASKYSGPETDGLSRDLLTTVPT
jgi:hypothetical protein